MREAVASVNAAANVGKCVATGTYGTSDTITVPTGTYTLGAGQLSLSKSVIINGNGSANTIIDGNNASGVFDFSVGTSSLNGVTVQNGNTGGNGGGVLNRGNGLTITNLIITANTASGWGGGILTQGSSPLTLTDSTVSNNTAPAGQGAGIRADGVLNITGSTISGNNTDGLSYRFSAVVTVGTTNITGNSGGDCIGEAGGTLTDNGGNTDSDGTCFGTAPPTVTTNPASSIGQTGATLNGAVNDNGASTTATFDYGLTNGYGTSVTADQSPVAGGSGATAVSKAITGLACGTTYHYKAVGVNSGGTTSGADATFTTSVCPIDSYTLDVTIRGDGSGSVNGSGINCPGTCAATFAAGTVVTLNASPDSGNALDWWGGACEDQWRGDSCKLAINADTSVVADFEPDAGSGGGGDTSGNGGGTTGAPSGNDAPFLTEPADGGTTGTEVTFMYGSGNNDGSTLELFVCENADFAGCASPSATTRVGSLAALGGVAGLLMFGFAFIGRRRIPYMLAVIALGGGLLLSSCGSSSSSSGDTAGDTVGASNGTAETTLSLNPNTTYYWKVVATDSAGNATTTGTWSFTTGS